jgi:hypothetical protein
MNVQRERKLCRKKSVDAEDDGETKRHICALIYAKSPPESEKFLLVPQSARRLHPLGANIQSCAEKPLEAPESTMIPHWACSD